MTLLFKCYSCVEYKHALLVKIASVREVVLGAPLRGILKKLTSRTVASNTDGLVALVHRPNESFFLIPQVKLQIKVNKLSHCSLSFVFSSLANKKESS